MAVLSQWAEWRDLEDVMNAVKTGAPRAYEVGFGLAAPAFYQMFMVYAGLEPENQSQLQDILQDAKAVVKKGQLFLAKLPEASAQKMLASLNTTYPFLARFITQVRESKAVKKMLKEAIQREKEVDDLAEYRKMSEEDLRGEEIFPASKEDKVETKEDPIIPPSTRVGNEEL